MATLLLKKPMAPGLARFDYFLVNTLVWHAVLQAFTADYLGGNWPVTEQIQDLVAQPLHQTSKLDATLTNSLRMRVFSRFRGHQQVADSALR